jgi:hypothetical protein
LCYDDDQIGDDDTAIDAGHVYSDNRDVIHHRHHSISTSGATGSPHGVSTGPAGHHRTSSTSSTSSNGAVSNGGHHRRESSISTATRVDNFRRGMSLLDHNIRYLCAKQRNLLYPSTTSGIAMS